MIIEGRLPTLDEVRAAITPPLSESYWWFEGWNFNRPVIAEVGRAVRIAKTGSGKLPAGSFVWCKFFEEGFNSYLTEDDAANLAKHGAKLKFTGPILYPGGEQSQLAQAVHVYFTEESREAYEAMGKALRDFQGTLKHPL